MKARLQCLQILDLYQVNFNSEYNKVCFMNINQCIANWKGYLSNKSTNMSIHYSAKRILFIFLMIIGGLLITTNSSAAITSTATGGNWSVGSSWSGGIVPGSGDAVIIASGATITVDGNITCASLSFGTIAANTNLNISGTNTLNITGALTYTAQTGNSLESVNVGAGTLNCASVTMTATGTTSKKQYLNIGTGTFAVTGNFTCGASSTGYDLVVFSGAGTMKLGAGMTNSFGLTTATSCTFEFNGTAAQTIPTYSYVNLTISNTGATCTLAATTTLTGNLSIIHGANLSISSYTFNVAGNISNSGQLTGTGNFIMNGASGQTIGGDVTGIFTNVRNSTGSANTITLSANQSINGTFGLNNSLINVASYQLTLGSSAVVNSGTTSGSTFTSSCMFKTDGSTGKVIKQSSAALTLYVIPVGTGTNYLPATITTANATNITVQPISGVHSPATTGTQIGEYWRITSSAATAVTSSFTFPDAITPASNVGSYYKSSGWIVTAINPTGSSSPYSISYSSLSYTAAETVDYTVEKTCTTPTNYTVSGTLGICSGNSTNINLSSSQSGVTYDLIKDGTSQSSTKTGTGSGLTWSVSATGTYTVNTTTSGGYCATLMSASAVITLKTNVGIGTVTAAANSICANATQTYTANNITGTNNTVTWYPAAGGFGGALGTGNTLTAGPGIYYARVTGDCGTPTEAFVTVSTTAAPGISNENLSAATYLKGAIATALSITASGATSYQWYKSSDAVVDISDVAVGTSIANYTPLTTTAGITYYYCVVTGSCTPKATSNVSGAIIIQTQLLSPTINATTNITNQGFTANWTDVSNENSYTINVYDTTNTIIKTINNIAANTTSYVITGLNSNTKYTFTVTAIGDGVVYINSSESTKSSTIRTLNTLKDFTAFIVAGVTATIGTNTIIVTVPNSTDITNLTPIDTASPYATISPSGVQNFTGNVIYTITAEDGSTKQYTVTVTKGGVSTNADITAFNFAGQVSSIIGTNTIRVVMPSGTMRYSLSPSIAVSSGATVTPNTGIVQDFRTSKIYTVTAQDGITQKTYTVTVTNQSCTVTFDIASGNYFDLGSGSPRYYDSIAGIGRVMRSINGSSSFSISSGGSSCSGSGTSYIQTTGSAFAFQMYNAISKFTIYGSGTGTARTLSSVQTGTTPNNYSTITASATGAGDNQFTTQDVCDSMTIVPAINIAANQYVAVTLSGNINLYKIVTTPVGCVAPQLLTSPSINATNITNQGFTANWTDVSNEIGYIVNVYDSTNTLIMTINNIAANTTSTVITALNSNTKYTFTVIATGDGDAYSNSNETTHSSSIRTLSTLKDMTAFIIAGVTATIGANTITATVPYGTDLTNLTPLDTASPHATISPIGAQNFSSNVIYTVTAEDGSTKQFTVTITKPAVNNVADITVFTITGQLSSTIGTNTVLVVMPSGTSRYRLSPAITVSLGATVTPNTSVSQDFRTTKSYIVTAQDGITQKTYTVTVIDQSCTATFDVANGNYLDFGSGSPRYYDSIAGVGRVMKSTNGSSSFNISSGGTSCAGSGTSYITTGSSSFAFQMYNAISKFTIYGSGTGTARTLTSVQTGTTPGNYSIITATATGAGDNQFTSQDVCDSMTIVPASNIAANQYVAITLTGNINLYKIVTTLVGCIAPQLLTSPTINATNITNQGFTANWTDVSNEIGYIVKIYDSTNTLVNTINNIAANTTSIVITGLSSNTKYTFTVTAIGDGDAYSNSNESAHSSTIRTLSTLKDMTAFIVAGVKGTIGTNTITVVVPWGTDLTNLTPFDTASPHATISPTGAQNFTGNVIYTVTAEDGSSKQYTITITVSTQPVIISSNSGSISFSTTGWVASANQSIILNGGNLNANVIATVTAPFQVSINGTSGWGTTVSFTPVSKSLTSVPLYIRYNPASGTGVDNSTLTLTSTGAASVNITLSGISSPLITQTAGASKNYVKTGVVMSNIIYNITGSETSANITGLPSGLTYNYTNGTLTVSGTPSTTLYQSFPYTITIIGASGSTSSTRTDTIKIYWHSIAFLYTSTTPPIGSNKLYSTLLADSSYYVPVIIASSTASDTVSTSSYMQNIKSKDLLLLHENIASANITVQATGRLIGTMPFLNTKAHMYGKANWPAGSGQNGLAKDTLIKVSDDYLNHPVFAGITINTNDSNKAVLAGPNGVIRYATGITFGNGIHNIANNRSNAGPSIIESNNQTNNDTKKYMLISMSAASEDFSSNGLQLYKNACEYLLNSTVFSPVVIYDVTGTATICTGSDTVIKLSNSQTKLSYQLYKDGKIFGSTVAGTGAALTWRVSGAGVYTVQNIATGNYPATFMNGSATINVSLPVTPALSITANPSGSVFSGTNVTFTATPVNGGSSPSFQWNKNGNPVGTNSTTYTDAGLANNDLINCVITANNSCQTTSIATSNSITTNVLVLPNYVWTGTTSTVWSEASNWSNNILPTTGVTVTIPSAPVNQPLLSSDVSIGGIVLNGTVGLNGHTFSITDVISGTGVIKGSATSSLVVNSSSNNTIYFGSASSDSLLFNLTISGSGIVSLGSGLGITGLLSINSGSLVTQNHLTLKSTSISNTAIVGPVGGTVTGNVTIERFVPQRIKSYQNLSTGGVYNAGTIFKNWQESGVNTNGYGIFITGKKGTVAGVDPTTGLDITPAGNISAYNYVNGVYVPVANTKTTNLDPYTGYLPVVYGNRLMPLIPANVFDASSTMNAPATIRTTGSLVTGTITFSTTGVTGTLGSNYNSTVTKIATYQDTASFVANPYACVIDWNSLAKNGITTSYWYYDPNTTLYNGTGQAFVAYNAIAGTNSNPGKSKINRYIQPGQGFWLETDLTNGPRSLTITEANKVTGSTFTSIFGTGAAGLNRLAISLWNDSSNIDGAVAVFDNNFTKAIGDEDTKKMFNNGENIYIQEGLKTLSIDGLPTPSINDIISLKFSGLTIGKTYSIRLDAQELNSNGLSVYLLDANTNTETLLSTQTGTVYSFKATAVNDNHYSVIFRTANPLSIQYVMIKATTSKDKKTNTISWALSEETNIVHYDVEKSYRGSDFIKIGTVISTNAGSYNILDYPLNSGINYYRIKVVDIDGKIYYSQVVKVINSTDGFITIAPNPVAGNMLFVQLNNVENGYYTVNLYNCATQLVIKKEIEVSASVSSIELPINNDLVNGVYNLQIKGANTYKAEVLIKR